MSNGEAARAAASPEAATNDRRRVVSCDLVFDVRRDATLELQIAAAASGGRVLTESLAITVAGAPVASVDELAGLHGTRLHLVQSPRGRLDVAYRAEIEAASMRAPEEISSGGAAVSPETAPREFLDIVYLRPSRYCPSDHLEGFAAAEFDADADASTRVQSITDWIRRRIEYSPGYGTVHDSAEDTLLTGVGACRDFAHLGIALCRASGVAARFVAVYAPGLSPMDFHAVFETLEGGRWLVHDPTGLAPRRYFVRIATGRDAADVAFASFERQSVTLGEMSVSATTGGSFEPDDGTSPVELA